MNKKVNTMFATKMEAKNAYAHKPMQMPAKMTDFFSQLQGSKFMASSKK
mgnify:CR=1 FL=1